MEPKRPRLMPDWQVTPAYGPDLAFEHYGRDLGLLLTQFDIEVREDRS